MSVAGYVRSRMRPLIGACGVTELKPLSWQPAIADMRLVGVQRQTSLGHPDTDEIEGGIRRLARLAQDDEVVCIPHHTVSAFGQQLIQRVEIDVGQ